MLEPSGGDAVPTRAPYYSTPAVTVHVGDCLDVLRGMPDASVDAVVTDPPYGLAKLDAATVVDAITAWTAGDRARVPDGRGFLGKEWDRFVPPPAVWDECLRVLKPGGHLLVFAGARTYDLMGLAIRMAGFEIRDTLQWLYGSGFPKGLDVAKAIDKAAGHWRGRAGAVTTDNGSMTGANYERTPKGDPVTAEAARWEGWNTTLKPSWEPIIMARKPLAGSVAANVMEHGTGGINIDGCRVGAQETADAPAGRWPSNVVLSHAADCAEECADGCPVPELDAQSGVSKSQRRLKRTDKSSDIFASVRGHDDEGGASRFFPTFRYQSKAPASERPRLPDGTAHPTVKPLALLRWLVRLVTPPGGLVLDPFAGSGTTGEAALLEGFRSVLVELDDKHGELIRLRLDKHTGEPDAA